MVELIKPELTSKAAESMGKAFADDPFLVWLEPDDAKRPAFGRWFFSKGIAYGRRWGEVYCSGSGDAAATWLTPGNTDMPITRVARVGMLAMPLKIGARGMGRFLKMMSVTAGIHKRSAPGPHWFLLGVGVDPDNQGGGVGSALIDAGFAQADEAHMPCYVEVTNEPNLGFYSKKGFEVQAEGEISPDFKIWGLVRPAR